MSSIKSITSTLVVIPYCPITECSNYHEQFYSFVDSFRLRLSRELEEESTLVQVVVIDAIGRILDSHVDKNVENISDNLLNTMGISFGAMLNTAYFIAKHSKVPFERILFHEPFFMPNRNLMQLYFQYPSSMRGTSQGLIHFTSVYRELFPKSSPYMGVFSIDTEMFRDCNGFPTHLTDRVQVFERFMVRVRRICSPVHVYSNDVDRTSMFYHLYYEDVLGDLRRMPQKDIHNETVQWSDATYSVLDDEYSGISQMPFFETHHVQEVQFREEHDYTTVKVMRYVVRPSPLIAFYNDFPQRFDGKQMDGLTEYYDFMTELMNYIILRLRQTYYIRASIHHDRRHSKQKSDEVIRVYLSDDDTEDPISLLYGFRAITQVIEESKRWIEEFYRTAVSRDELNRYEFIPSIMENICYYMVPLVHPDYPNEVQISILNYTFLYKDTTGREKKVEVRRQMQQKWMNSLLECMDTLTNIPTIHRMPIFYIPSLQIHTKDYIESMEEDMDDIYETRPVEIVEETRGMVREIPLGKTGVRSTGVDGDDDDDTLVIDDDDTNVRESGIKTIRVSSASMKPSESAEHFDDTFDDANEYAI